MSRRHRGRTTRARGRQCRRCGADEWTVGSETRCAVCARQRAIHYARRSRRDPVVRLYRVVRDRARQDGIEFDLVPDDIRAAWPRDHRCPVLGIPLRPGTGVVHDGSPTLDRLNPVWGYVPGNVVVVSYAANRAKGNLRAEQLARIAGWMRASGLE